jgi:PAT family acetyl-CoA transporter-like MFS transporter 1
MRGRSRASTKGSGSRSGAAAASARGGGEEGAGSSSSPFFYLFADSPRKSWIVPVQLLTSALLLIFGPGAARAVSRGDVPAATLFFFALVLLAATQDIAVDGWALTLLSRERVGWASTCQTVGTNLGFFASSAALLALGDPGFCARWVFRRRREEVAGVAALVARARRALAGLAPRSSSLSSPSSSSSGSSAAPASPALWSLGSYLLFWGWAYLAVTLFVAACVPEKKRTEEEEEERGEGGGGEAEATAAAAAAARAAGARAGGPGPGPRPVPPLSEIALAYRRLAAVARLPAVRRLCALLLTCRLAILPAEAAAALALSERGVPRRALAALVLLQLPAEALAAFLAGRAAGGGGSSSSSGKRGGGGASGAWVRGYWLRLAAALATTALVVTTRPTSCPLSPSSSSSSSSPCLSQARFAALALAGLLTAFSATLQFTCMGAVFARVADPRFGGSDLTLLNSVANLGITLPKGLVLWGVDAFGLGRVSTAAVLAGAVAGAGWYARELPRLEALPESAWRAAGGGGGGSGAGGKKEEEKN